MRSLAVYLVLLAIATAATNVIGIAGVDHGVTRGGLGVVVKSAADPVAEYILGIARHMREAGMVAEARAVAELVAQHRYGEALRLILYYFGEPVDGAGGGDTVAAWPKTLGGWSSIRGEAGERETGTHPRIVIGRLEEALREDMYAWRGSRDGEQSRDTRRDIGGLGQRHPAYPGRPATPHPGLIDKLRAHHAIPIERSSGLNTTAGIVRGTPSPLPYRVRGDAEPAPVKKGWA